jgi:hypothetical protein
MGLLYLYRCRIPEKPFITKSGTPSIPKDFDGRSRLIALSVSETRKDFVGRESDDGKSAESPPKQWLLKIVFKVRSNSFCNFTRQV